MLKARTWLLPALIVALMCGVAGAAEKAPKGASAPQEWELVIPNGEIQKTTVQPAPRINTLEGKNVVLRWNGKNNGDIFLDRLAVLLQQKYPTAKIVKSYTDSRLNTITGNQSQSMFVTNTIVAMKPDLVIAAQAD